MKNITCYILLAFFCGSVGICSTSQTKFNEAATTEYTSLRIDQADCVFNDSKIMKFVLSSLIHEYFQNLRVSDRSSYGLIYKQRWNYLTQKIWAEGKGILKQLSLISNLKQYSSPANRIKFEEFEQRIFSKKHVKITLPLIEHSISTSDIEEIIPYLPPELQKLVSKIGKLYKAPPDILKYLRENADEFIWNLERRRFFPAQNVCLIEYNPSCNDELINLTFKYYYPTTDGFTKQAMGKLFDSGINFVSNCYFYFDQDFLKKTGNLSNSTNIACINMFIEKEIMPSLSEVVIGSDKDDPLINTVFLDLRNLIFITPSELFIPNEIPYTMMVQSIEKIGRL